MSNSQSQSQSQSNGASSPLFFPSSNPSSDVGGHRASSPINYSSSVRQSLDLRSDLNSDSNRGRRTNTQRGDLNSLDSRRYFSDQTASSRLDSDATITNNGASNPNEPVRVIWGTNVSIQECSNNFRNFLMSFQYKYRRRLDEEPEDAHDENLYYVSMLKEMRLVGSTNLNLDTKNLLAYKPTEKLYHQLQNYPQEVIPIMDQTVKDCMISLASDSLQNVEDIETNVYKVRPFNLNSEKGMRELNPSDIDKLVTVKGLVLRTSAVIPDMKAAFFKCRVCDHTMTVEIDRGVISEPSRCLRCQMSGAMAIVHNRSTFSDKQVIKLQETPDAIPAGQTPHSVALCAYDELVDSCRAGDRIEVCGIFRSVPVRLNSRQRAVKSLFKTYLDVVHVKKVDAKRMDSLESAVSDKVESSVEEKRKLTEEQISHIKEVASRANVYEKLALSLAPSIHGLEDVKKGLLLQLFGGTNKEFSKGGRYRGDINILLCGDPSTSKSQLLQYVHQIAPRGLYTSGKGSSAVGLTAYVTRDTETKQLVLESGALVLSDGGVCCIDEFDKMSDNARSVLHEVMEQQTVSVAKAGIITTLNARTSILASANPIGSRYNPDLPVTKNIDLPPPLLSRFDLVYLVLDKVDPETDRELATHLARMYLEDEPETAAETEIFPIEFLTRYIGYAKENIKPVITDIAKDALVKAYVDMRKLGEDVRGAEKRITATTRQLESMIRLSEAHAKMRLCHKVELQDVEEAVRLIKSAIKDYATDPVTGKIDMDLVQTGRSVTQRLMKEDLVKGIVDILQSGDMTYNELVRKVNENVRVENVELTEALNELQKESRVAVTGEGSRRVVRLLNG